MAEGSARTVVPFICNAIASSSGVPGTYLSFGKWTRRGGWVPGIWWTGDSILTASRPTSWIALANCDARRP